MQIKTTKIELRYDSECLLQSVIEEPMNHDIKLILADSLDGQGLCGEAMRWAARRKKYPRIDRQLADYVWAWDSFYYWNSHAFSQLPVTLFEQIYNGYHFGRVRWSKNEVIFVSPGCAWISFINCFGSLFHEGSIGYRGKRPKKPKEPKPIIETIPNLFQGLT